MKKKILASVIEIITIINVMIIIAYAAVGWQQDEHGWRYFHDNGQMSTNIGDIINGHMYYFDQNGYMQTGWQYRNMQIRDLNQNIIKTKNGQNWYYFDPATGSGCVGWKEINNFWHYFTEDGGMLTDTVTPDGKYVDVNGIWIPDNSKYTTIGDAVKNVGQVSANNSADTYVSDDALANEIVQLVNLERQSEGKKNLLVNDLLMKAASVRADELATVFDHTRPDGKAYLTVFDDLGIDWHSIGENLAYQTSDSAKSVMDGWMKSSGHRVNILNKDFEEIGVATWSDGVNRYWVQLFIN